MPPVLRLEVRASSRLSVGVRIVEVGMLYALMRFANRAFLTFCAGIIRISRMVESGEMKMTVTVKDLRVNEGPPAP